MKNSRVKRFTRLYTWTYAKNRGKVNLQRYTANFDMAIGSVLPDDYDTFISVGEDDYIIDTAKPITRRQAQQIGERLAIIPAIGKLTTVRNYSHSRQSRQLFKGIDISE